MKLKALFMEEPVDFEKRCRLRILVGKTGGAGSSFSGGRMVLWKFWDCGWRQLYPGILYLDRDRLYGRRGCIRLEEPEISEG